MSNTFKIIVVVLVLSVLLVGNLDCKPIKTSHGMRPDNISSYGLIKKNQAYGVKSGGQDDQEFITVEPSDFAFSNTNETHDPSFEYGNEDDMLVGR